jgi:hypothetical protein
MGKCNIHVNFSFFLFLVLVVLGFEKPLGPFSKGSTPTPSE